MKLDPDGVRRRRRIRAAAFACGMLLVLAVAWALGDRHGVPIPLLALPLAGIVHTLPGARAAWRGLAARPLVSAVLVGALALALNAALALLVRMPQPTIHDEFSYLLAADTFAHGRLTNPTHPMWVHFEAPHIIHQPTYQSKYPPGQGLMLALGQVALGLPIAGLWLGAGLACGALTWMLAGWMPGRWALAGGLLAVVHPVMIDWSQSYWGGVVATFGGALFLGALGRLLRRPRARHAVVLGVGLGILANSRPYEGLLLSLPFLLALGIWLLTRRGPPARAAFTRILLPAGGVLAVIGSAMLYYNHRVTGDALTMPYLVHERTYGGAPLFRFQDPRPAPVYRHDKLRRFFAGDQPPERTKITAADLAAGVWPRVNSLGGWSFRTLSAVVVVGILLPLERSGWPYVAILGLGVFLVGSGLQTWLLTHYAAPVAGLALLVTLRAVRHVGPWRPGGIRLGPPLTSALWLFAFATLALESWNNTRVWAEAGWPYERARIAAELGRSGRSHLVILRYSAGHDVGAEWVYNGGNIDAAPVVWAQEMDAGAMARLLDYFRDRQAWLVEPDQPEIRPVPYPGVPPPSGSGRP
jgi:hypothetical protein